MLPMPVSSLRWLAPDENRFGIRCLDCREFSRAMITSTGDPTVSNTFTMLRSSLGEHVRGHLPRNTFLVPCDPSYPSLKGVLDGPLSLASVMEEKWDIYLFDKHLYFARSWTGNLIFKSDAEFREGRLFISTISADAKVSGKDRRYIISQVDYLIKTHLYHHEVPHPLPAGLPDDVEQLAMFSFSQYGRLAAYATFEDTVGLEL